MKPTVYLLETDGLPIGNQSFNRMKPSVLIWQTKSLPKGADYSPAVFIFLDNKAGIIRLPRT